MSSSRAPLGFFGLVLLATIGCDQASKHAARAVLPVSEPIETGRVLTLFLTENAGAFLSVGSGLPEAARFWLLTVCVGIGLSGVLIYLLAAAKPSAGVLLGMTLVAAGGLSNLIDRLARDGLVTDFLILHVGPIRTGIFNLADVAITAGTVLLGIDLWRRPRSPSSHGAV